MSITLTSATFTRAGGTCLAGNRPPSIYITTTSIPPKATVDTESLGFAVRRAIARNLSFSAPCAGQSTFSTQLIKTKILHAFILKVICYPYLLPTIPSTPKRSGYEINRGDCMLTYFPSLVSCRSMLVSGNRLASASSSSS